MTERTKVVNIKRNEPYDVYIGRAGHGEDGYFGNPYKATTLGGGEIGRKEAIARFAHYFKARVKVDAEYREKVLALKGKRLGCFCSPLACHGDVYVKFLEREK